MLRGGLGGAGVGRVSDTVTGWLQIGLQVTLLCPSQILCLYIQMCVYINWCLYTPTDSPSPDFVSLNINCLS